MLVKSYFLTWIALIIFASILWLTGWFSMVTALILGAFALTLVFSGLIGVLPSTFHSLLKHH